ncbi:hypothetical protein [Zavarzinia compransoris]|uniref:Uncharacterized protein n=1 Tax=Zavarzinia compransoris TaxID=1264899 RepID=A0A317E4H3_9PROT|nr:hypothetical protein [Zavarzinia compransoris]PWR21056.1 hypothetical protein DKG75_13800 [Zavarzinia compransoris]TDP44089.1 hypothetical protein DES42_108136 [Zavarzinia compransoris]
MARGLILGTITDGSGDAIDDLEVSLSAVRGADCNGILVQYDVPLAEKKIGSFFFSTKVKVGSRPVKNGVFAIPFAWPTTPDNLGRVAGVDLLAVKITAIDGKGVVQNYWGKAAKVIDGIQLVANIKSGQVLLSGSPKDILKSLKPEMKKAVKGEDLSSIPFTLLSTDQIALLGLMPDLTF